MKYKQLVRHFGGLSKSAQALGLNRQTVHAWGVRDRIPGKWQMKAQALSGGALRADHEAKREALEMASYVDSGARGP